MFDLILQNNASKKIYLYKGLENDSENNLYIRFSNFEFVNGEPDGEYTYYLIFNGRNDVVYEFKDTPINTILHTGDGDVKLGDLQPKTGLLRIGKIAENKAYRNNKADNEFIYRNE